MANIRAVDGFDLPPGSQPPLERCHECIIAKMSRKPFQNRPSPKSTRIGMLIFSDVCGPMQVTSLGGARYYLLFRDEYSNFRAVQFIKQKSVPERCKAFIALPHTQTGELVTEFRSDGGTEYLLLDAWLNSKGIRHQTTGRYSPQQNAIKRDNHTVEQLVRALLYSNKNIPLTLWAEATSCVVYQPRPFFRKSYQNTIRAMVRTQAGCIQHTSIWIRILRPHPEKLDVKAHLCIFVGNSDTQKGDRYWDPSTGKVNVSRDVSPIDHYYPPRLLTIDIQMGGDVFSTCIRDQISDDKEEVAIDQVEDRLIIPTGATNDTSD